MLESFTTLLQKVVDVYSGISLLSAINILLSDLPSDRMFQPMYATIRSLWLLYSFMFVVRSHSVVRPVSRTHAAPVRLLRSCDKLCEIIFDGVDR